MFKLKDQIKTHLFLTLSVDFVEVVGSVELMSASKVVGRIICNTNIIQFYLTKMNKICVTLVESLSASKVVGRIICNTKIIPFYLTKMNKFCVTLVESLSLSASKVAGRIICNTKIIAGRVIQDTGDFPPFHGQLRQS